jgi:phytoene dehydrogenase-like protein
MVRKMSNITKPDWDVIVIGAGIGGLTAAARLCQYGARVLVLDKNLHVGGTAYAYERNGFTFPMGPLGFSSPGKIHQFLDELGLHDSMDLNRVHYRVKAFGLDVPLSLNFAELAEMYSDLTPVDHHAIHRFFSDIERISVALGTGGENSRPDRSELLTRASRTPAAEYIGSLNMDPRWQRILGSLGTGEPYSSLSLLAAMWGLMAQEGIYYPSGGLTSFSRYLARGITDNKTGNAPESEIRLGTGVKQVLVDNRQVKGVLLVSGEMIAADRIISNADFKNTFLKLVPAESLPLDWLKDVRSSRQTSSNLQVCLGLNSNQVDLGLFSQASRIIYREQPAGGDLEPPPVDWHRKKISMDLILDQEMELSLWSRDDPGLVPPDKAALVIRTEADYDHFARLRPAPGKRHPAYGSYKQQLARAIIAHLEPLLPGLSGSIQVTDVATPITFEERGGRSRGAVAGWSWDYGDSRDEQVRQLVRTPLEGLYMAGYQALSSLFSGGVPTAMESGLLAARSVMEKAGPDTPVLP